ncbi:phosphopantothenoylcysteine decarboxylase [Acetivibrio straminisolvens JCM 21531]|uniref:Phosphopantothenoylcysteine decarboxylase n=1 Tax=Acetivibrio straminisolvens JCM 21531 TaxID=1294263 RepID=W4V6D7_9FIRM|nr:phosphopantothenoylcysteine decarboxylase [Acetivibrio straminisolvens JCM 21531]
MLKGKTVVVGVCGGIAAYKAVELVSRLKKLGADVHVIMTANAVKFVAPLTFRSICHNPVITDMFEEPKMWDIQHVSLAQKADLIVVAPATANIIAKLPEVLRMTCFLQLLWQQILLFYLYLHERQDV